jgi:Fe2+ or Zn2+ uptake regulation protein
MYDRLHAYLTAHHRSVTRTRDEVYGALLRQSPGRLAEVARDIEGRVPQATFYRTINLFIEIGVAEMIRQDVIALRAPFRQHVHYLLCEECGQTVGFNDERLERELARLARARPWNVAHHRLELEGRCGRCVAGITRGV